jgi:hypothetical protein
MCMLLLHTILRSVLNILKYKNEKKNYFDHILATAVICRHIPLSHTILDDFMFFEGQISFFWVKEMRVRIWISDTCTLSARKLRRTARHTRPVCAV